MFTTRLLSGIVLVILAVFFLTKGGIALFLMSLAISLIGLFELCRVVKIEKKLPGVIAYLSVIGYYGLLWIGKEQELTFLASITLMLLMAVYVFAFPKFGTEQITVAFFGVFYVGLLFSYLYQVRNMLDGKYLVWLIVISAWGCDTCAYCAGVLLGKHKLAPELSPKKTIEGAIGGVAGTALLGFLYGTCFGKNMVNLAHPGITCALACGIAGLISQIGDLAASGIKRNHNIKDYGHLIPGHGGILDRFDSMIFTAPAIYFAVRFLSL